MPTSVNGDSIPGQCGGVKAGHCRCLGRGLQKAAITDSNFKTPFASKSVRGTVLLSGLSLPPQTRNPSIRRPDSQSDALASRPPRSRHAPSMPDRFTGQFISPSPAH